MDDVTFSCAWCGGGLVDMQCAQQECRIHSAKMAAHVAALDASFKRNPLRWHHIPDGRGMSYRQYEREAMDMYYGVNE